MNATMEKFGWPATLLYECEHWAVLLRPQQPTLGSLVLAAKSAATAFGALPAGAHAELALASARIEAVLSARVGYAKLNYLMLMMVDPHVHFHVIPRYEGARRWGGIDFADAGWPGMPSLKDAVSLPEDQLGALAREFQDAFRAAA